MSELERGIEAGHVREDRIQQPVCPACSRPMGQQALVGIVENPSSLKMPAVLPGLGQLDIPPRPGIAEMAASPAETFDLLAPLRESKEERERNIGRARLSVLALLAEADGVPLTISRLIQVVTGTNDVDATTVKMAIYSLESSGKVQTVRPGLFKCA